MAMALKSTTEHMIKLIKQIFHDLEKSGNKAACQRVRTNTIKFAKVAKDYRKESIAEGRKGKKKTTKKKTAKKGAAPKRRKATKKKTTSRRKTTRKKRR